MEEFVAYIDEAGDEGLGKLKSQEKTGQSKWLSLGAMIVSKSNDKVLPKWRDDILELFPHKKTRDLHFHKLKHVQRVAASRFLASKQIGICVVCSNKVTLLDSSEYPTFKQKGHLYNYLVRFLLERITAAVYRKAQILNTDQVKLHVVFSRRGGTVYKVMSDYLHLMRIGNEKFVQSVYWWCQGS